MTRMTIGQVAFEPGTTDARRLKDVVRKAGYVATELED